MKKSILLIASVMIAFSSFAGGNGYLGTKKKGEGVLSNGFYLNLGLGFPSSTTTINYSGLTATGSTKSLGLQPSLEIGNQWYFWHNDKFGVGLKVSWFQFGYSSFKNDYSSAFTNVKNYDNFDIRLLKLAPEFSFAINEDIALDATFEVSPTFMIGGDGYKFGTKDYANVNMNFGALLAPGIRFRYKVFAVGFDYGFGTLVATSTQVIDSETQPTYSGTAVFSNPRVYLGFQF